MFTRPPSENSPPPYSPGYLAYPPGGIPSAAAEEAHLFRERVTLHREKLQQEREELKRAKAAQTAEDNAWQKEENARRIRRERIKEEALRAEIEWERMGGRVRGPDEIDAKLRRKLDEDARLTDEERAFRRAWEEYDKGWERLAMSIRPSKTFTFRKVAFTFADVPWPVLRQPATAESLTGNNAALELEDITGVAVAKFLLHPQRDPKKSKKEKLRDAMLRYHPDKFEGRILPRVVSEDRACVQEGVGIVMKCLNELMSAEH